MKNGGILITFTETIQITEQIRREASQYGVNPDAVLGRLAYGVGTNLITSKGAPSLSAVYKLSAVWEDNKWRPILKSSDSPQKIPNPGVKDLWRIYNGRCKATADLICCRGEKPGAGDLLELFHPQRPGVSRAFAMNEIDGMEPLLVEVMKNGRLVYDFPDIEHMNNIRQSDMESLDNGVLRLINPHRYHVSVSKKMLELKRDILSSVKDQQ